MGYPGFRGFRFDFAHRRGSLAQESQSPHPVSAKYADTRVGHPGFRSLIDFERSCWFTEQHQLQHQRQQQLQGRRTGVSAPHGGRIYKFVTGG